MIVDVMERMEVYAGVHARFAGAMKWVRSDAARRIEPGGVGQEHSVRVEIEGEEVFAIVQRYLTRRVEDEVMEGGPFWETHRKYIDVQCVMEGEEMMGWCPLSLMRVKKAYDSERDYSVLEDAGNAGQVVRVSAGMFAVFFPEDGHMPGLAADGRAAEVKKVVVKVRV